MKLENTLLEIAKQNNGIVTVRNVAARGYNESALRQYARRHEEKLIRHGTGVYEFLDDRLNVDPRDAAYMAALTLAGPESYLSGSTALEFYGLAYANPNTMTVRTPHHITRTLPSWLKVIQDRRTRRPDELRGIRIQPLADAFHEAKDTRADYRLEAVNDAEARNLLSTGEAERLRTELAPVHKRGR